MWHHCAEEQDHIHASVFRDEELPAGALTGMQPTEAMHAALNELYSRADATYEEPEHGLSHYWCYQALGSVCTLLDETKAACFQ